MKQRSNASFVGRKRLFEQCLLLSILCAGLVDSVQSSQLLRKRFDKDNELHGSFEDLWDHAAAAAQLELDTKDIFDSYQRELGMSMKPNPPNAPSFPTVPTRRPTISPLPPTPRPSFGPTDVSYDNLEVYLLGLLAPITPESTLRDTSTPQGQAFDFLVNQDVYSRTPCGKNIEQRYGLVALYFALNGVSWTRTDNWLSAASECTWFGVQCDGNLLVTELNLAINGLEGNIPNEIAALSNLRELDFFANTLRGTIPDGLSKLEDLVFLDLQENLLTGLAFPSSIVGLRRLESYRVNNNQLTGTIQTRVGSLRALKELWASNNDIIGTIPSEIGNLRNLETILLDQNGLQGALPTQLGLIPLEGLWLWNNNFQQTIPTQIFNLASLKTLRLEQNFFTGGLPQTLGQLTDIQEFRVDNNNLDGKIPNEIRFLTDLETLRLNNNFWTGTIPDVFQNYKRLDFFDVSGNLVTGTIPRSIFSIPTLRLVYLHECNIGGTIPPQYNNPPLLRDLYLYGNPITGTVPPVAAGELEKLNEFLLHDTNLTGTMPQSVCDLRTNFILDDLFTDCGGAEPEIVCDLPDCCNRCFEGVASSSS